MKNFKTPEYETWVNEGFATQVTREILNSPMPFLSASDFLDFELGNIKKRWDIIYNEYLSLNTNSKRYDEFSLGYSEKFTAHGKTITGDIFLRDDETWLLITGSSYENISNDLWSAICQNPLILSNICNAALAFTKNKNDQVEISYLLDGDGEWGEPEDWN